MRNAFAIGWRQLRFDLRRYAVTGIAISLGVALLLGTLLATQGIARQFDAGLRTMGGLADVGLVPEQIGVDLPEADVAAVSRLSGVEAVIPTFTRRTSIRGDSTRSLTVTGYPTSLNDSLGGLTSEGRLPVRGATEALLPQDVAAALGVGIGDHLDVTTGSGPVSLTVVGVVDPVDLGVLAYQNVFVDIDDARAMFSGTGFVTRIDVELATGTDIDEWQSTSAVLLPDDVMIQDTSAVYSAFRPILDAISLVLFIASFVTLGITFSLASTAFETVIRARQGTYGAIRAIGASARWLTASVIWESAILAVAASMVGVGLGLAVNEALSTLLTSIGGLTRADQMPSLWEVPVSMGFGVIAGVSGAVRALIRVLKRPPMTALAAAPSRPPAFIGAAVAGGVLIAIGASTIFWNGPVVALIGTSALILGCAIGAPAALPLITRLGGRLSWTARVSARRAVRAGSLSSTTSITAAVVCFGVALTACVGAIGDSMLAQLERQFGADVQITSPVPIVDGGIDDVLAATTGILAHTSTISDVVVVRTRNADVSASFLGVDPGTYFATATLPWVDGDDETTPRALAQGGHTILPAALAESSGISTGQSITLVRGSASVSLIVAGTYASLSTGNQVVIDSASAETLGASGATGWNVRADAGTSVDDLRARIAASLAADPGLAVVTAAEMKDLAVSQLSSYSTALYGMVTLSLALGAIGASGVFALGVTDRQHEIAILRAVGAQAARLRALVLWDAVWVSTAAAAVGVLVGQVAGLSLSRLVSSALGATLQQSFDPVSTAGIVVAAFAIMVLAAALPGRRAARIDPIGALRTE